MKQTNTPQKEIVNIFDIETTGLTGTDQIVCFNYGNFQVIQDKIINEKMLLEELTLAVNDIPKGLVVTFNGERKSYNRPGFDIPFIRTRYLVNGIPDEYPFRGMLHLDLMDIVEKYFLTTQTLPPTVEHLSATKVTELINILGMFPMKTKDQNVKQLKDDRITDDGKEIINEFTAANTETKYSPGNSLDHAFSLLCPNADENLIYENISGEDVPEIFEKFKETENWNYAQEILKHNKNCGTKTWMLYNQLIKSGLVSIFGIKETRL